MVFYGPVKIGFKLIFLIDYTIINPAIIQMLVILEYNLIVSPNRNLACGRSKFDVHFFSDFLSDKKVSMVQSGKVFFGIITSNRLKRGLMEFIIIPCYFENINNQMRMILTTCYS